MQEIENIPSFVLGIIVLSGALVTLILPESNIILFMFFHYFGILLSTISGILLLMASKRNNRILAGTGFGLGMAGWCLIIGFNIYGVIWNLYQIRYNLGILENLLSWQIVFHYNPILIIFFYINLIQPYQTGYTFCVVHICVTAICLVCGSVSFGLLIEKTRI